MYFVFVLVIQLGHFEADLGTTSKLLGNSLSLHCKDRRGRGVVETQRIDLKALRVVDRLT